jgi:hypothetical protein
MQAIILTILISNMIFTVNNQVCPDNYFYCGGKLCYPDGEYHECCGKGAIKPGQTCCQISDYSDYFLACEKDEGCCDVKGNNAKCYKLESQVCYNYNIVCSKGQNFCKTTSYIDKDFCCNETETCCNTGCCPDGYTCNKNYSLAVECIFLFSLNSLIVPIIVVFPGLFAIILFIYHKSCKKKGLQQVKFLNVNTSTNYGYNYKSNLIESQENPERIYNEIIEQGKEFSSREEFENYLLGYANGKFYKSSIVHFILSSCYFFAICITRPFIVYSLLFFIQIAIRYIHLHLTLFRKSYIKSHKISLISYIYNFILGTTCLFLFIFHKAPAYDLLNEGMPRMFACIFCLIFILPCHDIKMNLSGKNKILLIVLSAYGGSSTNYYGQTTTSSTTEATVLNIEYPSYLRIDENSVPDNAQQ